MGGGVEAGRDGAGETDRACVHQSCQCGHYIHTDTELRVPHFRDLLSLLPRHLPASDHSSSLPPSLPSIPPQALSIQRPVFLPPSVNHATLHPVQRGHFHPQCRRGRHGTFWGCSLSLLPPSLPLILPPPLCSGYPSPPSFPAPVHTLIPLC